MRNIKKKLAVLLCLAMAAPIILGCLPSNSMTAEAAGAKVPQVIGMYWTGGQPSQIVGGRRFQSITAEAGQRFNLGDLLRYYTADNYASRTLYGVSGVKYKSSNTKAATVSSKGDVKALNKGLTTITVTYGGMKVECDLSVEKKGTCGSGSATSKSLQRKAKTVIAAYGTKMSVANCYKVVQALTELEKTQNKVSSINSNGFRRQKMKNGIILWEQLAVPELLSIARIRDAVSEYAVKRDPITNKAFKVSSVSAKGGSRTVTVNLKSKVTGSQIFGLKRIHSDDRYLRDDKRAVFEFCVTDKSTGHRYYGTAVTKEGSRKLTVTMDYLKLKKGKSYILTSMGTEKTFKAK